MIFEKLAALLAEQFSVDVDSEFGLEEMEDEDLSGIATVADLVRYLKSKLDD